MRILAVLTLLFLEVSAVYAFQVKMPPRTYFNGEWEVVTKSLRRDGTYDIGRARVSNYLVENGNFTVSEFRQLALHDSVIYSGISLETFDPASGTSYISWMVNGSPHQTWIVQNADGTASGKGIDGIGEFLERSHFLEIKPDWYSWQMDRSYDDGKTWIPGFALLEFRRIKENETTRIHVGTGNSKQEGQE